MPAPMGHHNDMPQPSSEKKLDGFDKRILAYLLKEDWPVTTEMVGKELKISWNTAQLHLYKLKAESLVKGKRVGRQNQWMLTESGR